MDVYWFFPAEGVGSEANSFPPQNIEQLVAAQEADYQKREKEVHEVMEGVLRQDHLAHPDKFLSQ